jgi:transposase
MKKNCSICSHLQRQAIEAALAKGASVRAVAAMFSLGKSAVHVHATQHVTQQTERAVPGARQGPLRRLYRAAERALRAAEKRRDHRGALEAIDQLHTLEKQLVTSTRGKHGPTEPVTIHVVYDEPEPPSELTRAQREAKLVKELSALVDSTKVEAIAVYAARLVTLLSPKSAPPELVHALDEAEAGLEEISGLA